MSNIPDQINPNHLAVLLSRRAREREDYHANERLSEFCTTLLNQLTAVRNSVELSTEDLNDADLATLLNGADHLAFVLKNAQRF